jgi:hypothetical protein
VNEPVPRGFTPPQPNLGPEPWPEDQPVTALLVALCAVAFLLLSWFAWRLIRRRRRRAGPGSLAARDQPEDTPRGRLVALSHSIREALTLQLGTPWRAKTTEELSVDAQLEQLLGREGLRELIRFLDQVDRLKFAPERSNHGHESLQSALAAWEPRLDELKKKIHAKGVDRMKNKNASPAIPRSRNSRFERAPARV